MWRCSPQTSSTCAAHAWGKARKAEREHPGLVRALCLAGNVRELENLIYREYCSRKRCDRHRAARLLGSERRSQVDRRHGDFLSTKFVDAKSRVIAEFERQYLSSMLSAAEGNVTKRPTYAEKNAALSQVVEKHGIEKPGYRE